MLQSLSLSRNVHGIFFLLSVWFGDSADILKVEKTFLSYLISWTIKLIILKEKNNIIQLQQLKVPTQSILLEGVINNVIQTPEMLKRINHQKAYFIAYQWVENRTALWTEVSMRLSLFAAVNKLVLKTWTYGPGYHYGIRHVGETSRTVGTGFVRWPPMCLFKVERVFQDHL